MRLKKLATIVGVLIIDIAVAVVAIEALAWLLGYNQSAGKYPHGPLVFLKGRGTVIERHGNAFTYAPHMQGRNVNIHYSDADFEIDFDYRFPTNNLGLVQTNDVVPDKKSLLVVGDSYTEGVGSPPWFAKLAPTIEKHGLQPINGGLRGTGFHMWWQLIQHLQRQGLQIAKLVVIFTSPDFTAPPMSFPDAYLKCLSAPVLKNCNLEDYFFMPLPGRDQLPFWVDRIRKARAAWALDEQTWIEQRLKAAMPTSYRIYDFLRQEIVPPSEPTDEETDDEASSRAALQAMAKRFGIENILFIHVPIKNERSPEPIGLRARSAIAAIGGQFVDGFLRCGLSLSDYHEFDGHPNEAGYRKLTICVTQAIDRFAANRIH